MKLSESVSLYSMFVATTPEQPYAMNRAGTVLAI